MAEPALKELDPRLQPSAQLFEKRILSLRREIRFARVFRYCIDGLGGLATLGTTGAVACHSYSETNQGLTATVSVIFAFATAIYGYFRTQTTQEDELRIKGRTKSSLEKKLDELPTIWNELLLKHGTDDKRLDEECIRLSRTNRAFISSTIREMERSLASLPTQSSSEGTDEAGP